MAHVDDGARVPYRRWRRWVASLRRRTLALRAAESGGDPHDRVYLGYGVVLLALVYGPILWSALAQAAAAVPVPDGPTALAALVVAGSALALGVTCAAGLAAARAGGPLWTSPAEVTFALGGQFRARDVLRGRALLLTLGAGAVGAFVATAAAAGLAGGPAAAPPPVLLGAAAVAALLAQVPLAVGSAAQAPRRRRAAVGVTVLLLALGAVAALGAATPTAAAVAMSGQALPGTRTGVLAGAALVAVVGLLSAWLVVRVLPDELDVDRAAAGQARTVTAGRGLVGGDSGAVADVLGPRVHAGRAAGLPAVLLRRAPLLARDLLGLRRRPAAAVATLVAGCAGALLVRLGTEGGPALATVAGALALYGAARTWADGLHAFAAQPEPGALLPGTTGRAVAGHAVVPVALALLVAAASSVGAGADAVVAVLVLTGLALGARVWVAGATAAPPGLFTPMMTPNGDMSMLVLGAWYLRGWLVVAAAAWLLERAGPGAVTAGLVLALAAGLAAAGVRRFARA
ncbi:hypothetical protein SAMN04324258_1574 [Krasilnikoviella flava]|uniref:ABC-2 type transport system permease protein n=2 Tax=Krasilnikoviella flava TaxID=526729 RepID=A0A1T5JN73_9MICO|nr:hypothetical protein SAMN04324258_1574 [Krasilnikoviella flava]